EAVVAAEGRQGSHRARLPHEAEAGVSGHGWEEGGAAPSLPERIDCTRLGDSRDHPPDVLHRPENGAVRSSERAQVLQGAGAPERRVLALVSGQIREARYPGSIVDAAAGAQSATERVESRYLVAAQTTLACGDAGASVRGTDREHRDERRACH